MTRKCLLRLNAVGVGCVGDGNGAFSALDLGSELASGDSLGVIVDGPVFLHVLVRIEYPSVAARSRRDEQVEFDAVFELVFWTTAAWERARERVNRLWMTRTLFRRVHATL